MESHKFLKRLEVKPPKKKRDQDDDLQKSIGGIGKYHIVLLLFLVPVKIPTALHPLGIVFLAPPVTYTCNDDKGTTNLTNQCPCESPVYDTSVFDSTIITHWDLICDRKWMVSFAQTVHMLGLLVGSIVFGPLSDRFGRKPALLSAAALNTIAGIASSFSPDFWTFAFLRLMTGCSIGGVLIVSFVLVMEFTGKQYRELVSCLLQLPFNVGYVLLPIFGYYIRSWFWLNMSYSLPAAGFVFVYWILPETPRWLLTAGKQDEAIAVLEKVAKINGRPTAGIASTVRQHQLAKANQHQHQPRRGTIVDLFRTRNIRNNMLCVIVNWTVCSLGFFGLSQYVGQLNGDIFVNVSVSVGLNLVGTLATYLSMRWLNRRTAVVLSNLCTSVCLLLIAIAPTDWHMTKVVLACVGNLCAFVAFIVIYLYTTELFPTVVRNAAMGIASMFSRVGSMVAPFVVSLNATAAWLPPLVFGAAPLVAALLCLPLPETKGQELPDTLEEGEEFSEGREGTKCSAL